MDCFQSVTDVQNRRKPQTLGPIFYLRILEYGQCTEYGGYLILQKHIRNITEHYKDSGTVAIV